jgi:hypothetical protein
MREDGERDATLAVKVDEIVAEGINLVADRRRQMRQEAADDVGHGLVKPDVLVTGVRRRLNVRVGTSALHIPQNRIARPIDRLTVAKSWARFASISPEGRRAVAPLELDVWKRAFPGERVHKHFSSPASVEKAGKPTAKRLTIT